MTIAPQTIDVKSLRILPLSRREDLDDFSCGEREIDRNLGKCCDWHEIYSRRVYCAFLADETEACGFYCIGVSASESKYLDEEILRKHRGQNYVPFLYLNYLAVRSGYQGNRIGTVLLMNALQRCSEVIHNIGIYGVALHALSDRAAGLYDRYGFREYGNNRYPFMVLPARSVIDLFG